MCIPERPGKIGGASSFKRKLAAGLAARGVSVTHERASRGFDAVLLVNGTRHLQWLRGVRKRGIPVVQRLDGINWVHTLDGVFSRARWRDAARNWLTQLVRSRYADHVVYQSEFIKKWWLRRYGADRTPSSVIYNGVDTDFFSPADPEKPPDSPPVLVSIEGNLGLTERTLRTPVETWRELMDRGYNVRLKLIGEIEPSRRSLVPADSRVSRLGAVPHEAVRRHLRSASVLISSEVQAPCPNTVIEALACGTPVATFDTGSLRELVPASAGVVVDYGADPWKLEDPDIGGLADAVVKVLQKRGSYAAGARRVAVERFGLERMVSSYLGVIEAALQS